MPFFPCHYPVTCVPGPGDKQMGLAGAELSPVANITSPRYDHQHQPADTTHQHGLSVHLPKVVAISPLVRASLRLHHCIYMWGCVSSLKGEQLVGDKWMWELSPWLWFKPNLKFHQLTCSTKHPYCKQTSAWLKIQNSSTWTMRKW